MATARDLKRNDQFYFKDYPFWLKIVSVKTVRVSPDNRKTTQDETICITSNGTVIAIPAECEVVILPRIIGEHFPDFMKHGCS